MQTPRPTEFINYASLRVGGLWKLSRSGSSQGRSSCSFDTPPPKATLALGGGEGGVVRDGFVRGYGGGG